MQCTTLLEQQLLVKSLTQDSEFMESRCLLSHPIYCIHCPTFSFVPLNLPWIELMQMMFGLTKNAIPDVNGNTSYVKILYQGMRNMLILLLMVMVTVMVTATLMKINKISN